jgi:hypothetical protein
VNSRIFVAVIVCGGCAVYGSSLLVPADGGGVDAGADTPMPPKCPLARWPPRPAADDPSSGDVEIITAVSELHFLAPDAGVIGYDLDGICTCEGTPPGPESCVPLQPAQHCDGPNGIDNAGGDLLAKFQQIGNVFSDMDITSAVTGGSGGLLFRLQNYNGKPNDTQVTFSVYSSNGTPITTDGGMHPKPDFDGGDTWTIDSDSLVGGAAPPYVPSFADSSAYVTNGTIVSNVDFPLSVGTRSVARVFIKLKGGVITARVVPRGNGFQLSDGVIAGRFTTKNFLTNLQAFKDPFNSTDHLCGDSGTYGIVKTQVCRSADVSSDLLSDGKGAPCDGISVAFFFQAPPALFGPADTAMPAPPPCGVGYQDDCR